MIKQHVHEMQLCRPCRDYVGYCPNNSQPTNPNSTETTFHASFNIHSTYFTFGTLNIWKDFYRSNLLQIFTKYFSGESGIFLEWRIKLIIADDLQQL